MAFDLNASVGPIIDGVILLLPTVLELVIAMVPIVITLAVSQTSTIKRIFWSGSRVLTWILRQDPWHDQVLTGTTV